MSLGNTAIPLRSSASPREGELTVKRNGQTSIHRAPARLSRNLPAALAHRAGAADVAPVSKRPCIFASGVASSSPRDAVGYSHAAALHGVT